MKQNIGKTNINIFKNYLIQTNKNTKKNILPKLLINKGKNNNNKILSTSSFSNTNIKNNQLYRIQLSSNNVSLTDNNKRNSNTIEVRKTLNTSSLLKDNQIKTKVKIEKEKEKLKNLVNYFKELDDINPKTKYEIKTLNESNEKKYNQDISSTFTNFYRISRQQQKLDVIKLNAWDEDNLESFYGNTKILYQYLVKYYKQLNNKNKLDELDYFKRIIDSNGNLVDNILKSTTTNNKIIQNIKEQKNLEQGTILHNIISKTHYRFRNELINKDKKIFLYF